MNGLLKKSQLFVKRNASTMLTITGGVGVITTTVLAIKATPKALTLLEEAKTEKNELTKLETVKTVAPVYIPTIISGVTTLACIFGANMLNKRQQAALMSAYAFIDTSYKDYRKKTQELYSEDADNRIKEEIAKDKYEKSKVEYDKILFYDCFSEQYFESTLPEVTSAEYEINRNIHMRGWAELNEFYERLGIDNFDKYEAFGWSEGGNYEMYWQGWVDFNHSKITLDDGTECISIIFMSEPYIGYEDY